MLLTIITASLVVIYIVLIIIEKLMINKYRKSFKYVIHVNGIRGKSTTTRLIDAGLRACGFKVFSKTTGTFPTILNTNNEVVHIKRLGPANIREQIKMMRKAYLEHADVLVLECMAVNPELQYICEHQILNSDITLITNVRPDHLGDMGNTLEELAMALAKTIPSKGHLIIGDEKYLNIYKEASRNYDTKIHVAEEYKLDDDMDTFKDNIAMALEVSKVLELDNKTFFEGMKNYKHDEGAYKEIKHNDTIFMNALSVNDPESIKIVYDKATKDIDKDELTVLLCTREDRFTRTKQYEELISYFKCKKIYVSEISSYLYFKRKKIEVEYLKKNEDLNSKYVFATGNIIGRGAKILKYFEESI